MCCCRIWPYTVQLFSGQLPVLQRHAIITPLLEKSSLDPAELKNYRPLWNLTLHWKSRREWCLNSSMNSYLQAHNPMPRMRSAYRHHHSTETTLLLVVSYILDQFCKRRKGRTIGSHWRIVSAAFNMVDHTILLGQMRAAFGIDNLALEWIRTFLVDRTQQPIWVNCHLLVNWISAYYSDLSRFTSFSAVHGRIVWNLQGKRAGSFIACRSPKPSLLCNSSQSARSWSTDGCSATDSSWTLCAAVV